MKDDELKKIASILQDTWPGTYLRKNGESLIRTLTLIIADVDFRTVVAVIKDYAAHYENVPSIATISKLAHKKAEKPMDAARSRQYIEDDEGYGYLLVDGEYTCIWKPHWHERGLTKMETLKSYGIITY